MKRCVIIGSASCRESDFTGEFDRKNSFVVCADGGLDSALRYGVTPDLVVGDFDSAQSAPPENVETIRLKREKDDTDTMAAVKIAIRRGFRDFLLLGVLGGRIDHSIANLYILQFLAGQGCRAMISGDGCRVFLLNGGRLTLSGIVGATVSVFPFGVSSCTVSYEGLKYPLTETRLCASQPIGVSNVVVDENAKITVHGGNALIIVLENV
ncbi:MAG: thiamine diphosphokinase [Clostridiales bacterium]|nr:thiamine diphosphokinase [Clostridiales bacterium]